MDIREATRYLDAIRTREIEEYEKRIGEYQMMLNIQASSQSEKGYKQLSKSLEREIYRYREVDWTTAPVTTNALQKLKAIDQKMRRK